MNDVINSPAHYNSHKSGVEAIEICEHLDFCLGNAVKYLFRAGHKDPIVQDLRKAAWYLRRMIDRKRSRATFGIERALTKVLANEPVGSVLRDVLELTVQRAVSGHHLLLADALARVEREIFEHI